MNLEKAPGILRVNAKALPGIAAISALAASFLASCTNRSPDIQKKPDHPVASQSADAKPSGAPHFKPKDTPPSWYKDRFELDPRDLPNRDSADFRAAIDEMLEQGKDIQGYADSAFGPEKDRVFQSGNDVRFRDVPAEVWMESLTNPEIIPGYADGTFRTGRKGSTGYHWEDDPELRFGDPQWNEILWDRSYRSNGLHSSIQSVCRDIERLLTQKNVTDKEYRDIEKLESGYAVLIQALEKDSAMALNEHFKKLKTLHEDLRQYLFKEAMLRGKGV